LNFSPPQVSIWTLYTWTRLDSESLQIGFPTVDGRNPAPVDMINIPLFFRFYTSQVVVGDFFHQQYFVD